ncbi:MAG: PRiA4b ORF-3-like protein [Actinomycetia bacterium]|nr:PRiA4b ORF-3-like protein [Actinomycetes bacterium]
MGGKPGRFVLVGDHLVSRIGRVTPNPSAAIGCSVLSDARALAAWVGDGKPVTAKGVLRPSAVHEAAGALGIDVPEHIRTAADVEAIHRPWIAAQAIGLLTVADGRAVALRQVAEPSLEHWLVGFEAVLRAESHDQRRRGAAIACRLVLTALAADPAPAPDDLERVVHQLLDARGYKESGAVFQAFRRSLMPVEAALGLLQDFGAVDQRGTITPLGRWACRQLEDKVPEPVSSGLPAGKLLPRLAELDPEDARDQADRWLSGRKDIGSAGLLLAAAAQASPRERITAVTIVAGLGEDALPAWHAVLRVPALAAHARNELVGWDEGPGVSETDLRWLTVDYALAAVAKSDLEDAWFSVQDQGGLEMVSASGHPGAADLSHALQQVTASGGGRLRVHQLKIALSGMRPPVWRRLLVPAHATLGDLNRIIKIVMGWGEDHLHLFTVDDARYSDPYYQLDECGDQETIRLTRALPHPGTKITYVYDLGDWWGHEITLEKITDLDEAVTYPVCVTGRGEAPIEDWNPEYPEDPTMFDKDDLNRRLAKLR